MRFSSKSDLYAEVLTCFLTSPGAKSQLRVANPGERFWRVRKWQRVIDVVLGHHRDGIGIEIQFFLKANSPPAGSI